VLNRLKKKEILIHHQLEMYVLEEDVHTKDLSGDMIMKRIYFHKRVEI
jgi:hypothetical protein